MVQLTTFKFRKVYVSVLFKIILQRKKKLAHVPKVDPPSGIWGDGGLRRPGAKSNFWAQNYSGFNTPHVTLYAVA